MGKHSPYWTRLLRRLWPTAPPSRKAISATSVSPRMTRRAPVIWLDRACVQQQRHDGPFVLLAPTVRRAGALPRRSAPAVLRLTEQEGRTETENPPEGRASATSTVPAARTEPGVRRLRAGHQRLAGPRPGTVSISAYKAGKASPHVALHPTRRRRFFADQTGTRLTRSTRRP